MDDPLATIEYLARSEHRVTVLEAIRTEPRTREEIRSLTDASRVTAGRIIADLEDRGWIVRDGSDYEATTDGRYVAREFTRLMGNLEAYHDLPAVVEWLPDGEPRFDLDRLAEATVTTADEGDLIAPIRRAISFIERADQLVAVANGAAREFIEALNRAVEAGQTSTLLGPPDMIAGLRNDPDQREAMHRILTADRTRLFQYEGDTELPVFQIGDGTVALCSRDHRAMIETDDDQVHEWAMSYFETLQTEASRVPAETFSEPSTPEHRSTVLE